MTLERAGTAVRAVVVYDGRLVAEADGRRLPSAVEKAHSDIFNTLLRILDDGRLTDAQGRTVDFRHCAVIMTSDIGARRILDHRGEMSGLKDEHCTVRGGQAGPPSGGAAPAPAQ